MRLRLLLLLCCVACTDFLAPMPGDPELIPPGVGYARWYARAEVCTGIHGDFSRVRWYRYAGDHVPGRTATAVTWHRQHKIAITEHYLRDSNTVIHESIHDLIRRDDHPAEYFGTRPTPYARNVGGKCAGMVNGWRDDAAYDTLGNPLVK